MDAVHSPVLCTHHTSSPQQCPERSGPLHSLHREEVGKGGTLLQWWAYWWRRWPCDSARASHTVGCRLSQPDAKDCYPQHPGHSQCSWLQSAEVNRTRRWPGSDKDSPIAQDEVNHMQRGEILQLNGQMECRQAPSVTGEGSTHVHTFCIHLQQLLDVSTVHSIGQLLQQTLLTNTVLNVLALQVLLGDILTTEVTASQNNGVISTIHFGVRGCTHTLGSTYTHAHTHFEDSGMGLTSVRLASMISLRISFPMKSAI